MTHPKISVIIPVYNGEKYIKEAIGSVLRQTYQDFELIIIDDTSTDKSYATIEMFRNKYPDKIKAIKHDQNKGCPAASRNTGIKVAKGHYIAFMDQDDMWHIDKLKKQLEVIEKSPKVGLVVTNAQVYDNKSKRYLGCNWKTIEKLSSVNKTQRLLKRNFILTGSMALIKKEFFDKYGLLDENFKIADDYDLWFRISQHYQIYLIAEPLTVWRKTGTSTSFNEKNMLTDTVYFYEKRRKEGFVSDNLGYYCVRLANFYLAEKKIKQAKEYYQRANDLGYRNCKLSLMLFLLTMSPLFASWVIKNKRGVSQRAASLKDILKGCTELSE